MLSNLETDRDKLLQIILVGQPELRDILSAPGLMQLRQRIQINCHLQPLSPAEVREYISFRLEKAGNRDALSFSDDAVEAIATYTRGIPRLINILCDYIMIDAYSTQARDIDGNAVHELAADLSFESQYWDSGSAKAAAHHAAIAAPTVSGAEEKGKATDTYLSNVEALTQAVSGQAKILSIIGSLNKRLESLEYMPVWDHAALVDLRERLDRLELQSEATGRELWVALRQLRSDIAVKDLPKSVETIVPRKKGGLWKFLWGE